MLPRNPASFSSPWLLIAAAAAVTVPWMALSGLTLDLRSAALTTLTCLGLEALAAFYTHHRPDPRLAATLSALAQTIAFTAIAACLSYATTRTAGPLWDATLVSWDRGLGLDWRAYLTFVDGHPWLGKVYEIAYLSLAYQLCAILCVLGFSGRLRALRSFVLGYVICAVATVMISAAMPAVAMFAYLKLRPEDFPHLQPAAAYVHLAAVDGLRNGTMHVIQLDKMEGIITFPSFHAALAVLLTIGFWRVPWARWPALVLNAVLVAATPIDGGHYFVDLLAGGALAVLSALAAHKLFGISDEPVQVGAPRGMSAALTIEAPHAELPRA